MSTGFEIYFDKNRTVSQDIVLYQADGGGLTLNSGDKVRFRVWRRDQTTPLIDVNNIAALDGGSIVTVTGLASAAMATVKICQADIASVDPGIYDAEIVVVDSGDSNLAKSAGRGICGIFSSGGGSIGAT
jgi:hypothetical protein